MKITQEAWERLTEDIERKAKAINAKSDRLDYNPEVSISNGGMNEVVTMIVELEATIRVLKRRLVEATPDRKIETCKDCGTPFAI